MWAAVFPEQEVQGCLSKSTLFAMFNVHAKVPTNFASFRHFAVRMHDKNGTLVLSSEKKPSNQSHRVVSVVS